MNLMPEDYQSEAWVKDFSSRAFCFSPSCKKKTTLPSNKGVQTEAFWRFGL